MKKIIFISVCLLSAMIALALTNVTTSEIAHKTDFNNVAGKHSIPELLEEETHSINLPSIPGTGSQLNNPKIVDTKTNWFKHVSNQFVSNFNELNNSCRQWLYLELQEEYNYLGLGY